MLNKTVCPSLIVCSFICAVSSCGGPGKSATRAVLLCRAGRARGQGTSENHPLYGDFIGQTDAKETVNIVPRVTGFLEKVYFTEGAPVHKGQALFQIEQASYQASLESANAKVAEDQASLIRYDEMWPAWNRSSKNKLRHNRIWIRRSRSSAIPCCYQRRSGFHDTAQLNLATL